MAAPAAAVTTRIKNAENIPEQATTSWVVLDSL
jgi:hypothetical protein